MDSNIAAKIAATPIVDQLKDYQPLFWKNPNYGQADSDLPFSKEYIFDAVAR